MHTAYSTIAARVAPLCLIRHGLTDLNRRELACGRGTNCPLSEGGVAQIEALGERLARQQFVARLIVHSPMLRAKQSAQILADSLGAELQQDDDLAEQDLGSWEGLPWPDVFARLQANRQPPGGESRDSFTQRVWLAFARLVLEDGSAVRPIVVAHGGTFFALGWPWRRVSHAIPNGVPFMLNYLGDPTSPWGSRRLQFDGAWVHHDLYAHCEGASHAVP
ncbi:MAG: histidine phosphatase family protein [Deltaproteobacteria bacterium]|nr:MAG: histidine phosphatase family protein [Deltaproteobacteria bacterium]